MRQWTFLDREKCLYVTNFLNFTPEHSICQACIAGWCFGQMSVGFQMEIFVPY